MSACTCGPLRVRSDQPPLHLSEDGDDGEDGFAGCRVGVDSFGEGFESDVAGMQPLDDIDEVGNATPQPVEAPDDQGIVGAQGIEALLDLGAVAADAGSVPGVDLLATGFLESADLQLGFLVDRGHSGVADAHIAVTLENS